MRVVGNTVFCSKGLTIVIILLSSLLVVSIIYNPTITLSSNQSSNNSNDTAVTESSNFTSYADTKSGVNIQYPSKWQYSERFVGNSFIIQFFSPLQNGSDNFHDNINIAIGNLPTNITNLSQYSDANIGLISRSLRGFNYSGSNNSANLGGMPAVEKVFTAKRAILDKELNATRLDLKIMQLYTINNNKGYVLTYTAETPTYDKYTPTLQKMIDSFQILNGTSSSASNSTQGTTTNSTS
jgi:hypothetical protein